ncbi:hypothetical protein BKA70DRAFT_1569691 [Coprinopsis sp. MPI-PUGE-AT-0042]|nr:hypothetical protein BKA70DRAFT_1569691 [Coprinopsis sp. MPI-PUGE-AT-0042]
MRLLGLLPLLVTIAAVAAAPNAPAGYNAARIAQLRDIFPRGGYTNERRTSKTLLMHPSSSNPFLYEYPKRVAPPPAREFMFEPVHASGPIIGGFKVQETTEWGTMMPFFATPGLASSAGVTSQLPGPNDPLLMLCSAKRPSGYAYILYSRTPKSLCFTGTMISMSTCAWLQRVPANTMHAHGTIYKWQLPPSVQKPQGWQGYCWVQRSNQAGWDLHLWSGTTVDGRRFARTGYSPYTFNWTLTVQPYATVDVDLIVLACTLLHGDFVYSIRDLCS